MPIFNFESKKDKTKRETLQSLKKLAEEAGKKFSYDPDEDPVIKNYRRKIGLPIKDNTNN